ncbi:hypothetical protein FHP05_10180 [Cerasibacillus terrae]|uniref:Uncharacterized protein n=1 Tax=Cerasibacillus terrae TaxID=2498845 RepID=A0A5C8NSD5_9BACI|nr:hypothetical protein [Cerasibacillus terrae]TXL64046.1 hypothetical protein FHP05_10180 [Cerasibacillus terrae]
MNNEFLWQEDIDFSGIVIRFAIIKLDESGKYGACIAQMFDDEFIMVDAVVCNNFISAISYLLENAINKNLEKLRAIKDNLISL